MKKSNAISSTPKPAPRQVEREQLALMLAKIAEQSKKSPKGYVKNWVVPGGGE